MTASIVTEQINGWPVLSFRTEDAPDGFLTRLRPLLDDVFTRRFDDDDWAHALGGWHAALTTDGTPTGPILAHAAVAGRVLETGGRTFATGYVEAVATRAEARGTGAGSAVMTVLTGRLDRTWEFGALATGSHGFYARLGWEPWTGPSYLRRGAELIRTAGDDSSIMVRRHGASVAVDLDAAIVCDERPGAVW